MKKVLLTAMTDLDNGIIGDVTAYQMPIRLSVCVMKRLVSVFRDNVSYQDVCQLVSINESPQDGHDTDISPAFDTIAVRVSLMIGSIPSNIELEIQKHAWTAAFNCFQNEVFNL